MDSLLIEETFTRIYITMVFNETIVILIDVIRIRYYVLFCSLDAPIHSMK